MDDEAKIITSIIQLQTKKKRNVLDDILTIYENYVVRKGYQMRVLAIKLMKY